MLPLIGAAIASGALNLAGDIFTQTTARSAYKSRYQDEVKDLLKAGLNPALAYGANPGQPNTATFSGIGDAAMSGYQAAQQAKEMAARTDLTASQAALLKAQTADLVQNVRLKNNLIQADIINRDTNTAVQRTTGQQAQLNLKRSKATYNADVSRANTAAQIMHQQMPEAKAIGDWFRNHPDLGGWLNSAGGIANIMRALGTAATALPE